MSGITDLGADAAQASQSGNDDEEYESDYERFDLDGVSFGKQHPTTAVRGEAVALRKLWDDDDPDRADVAVILDNPSIVTSEGPLEGSVVVHGDDEGDQFKVVNEDDDDTKIMEDLIDFAGNTFYGDVESDFGAMDRIALKRGGGAGRSITSVLDVKGAVGARTATDEDGDIVLHDGGFPQHNGGLVEYHPDGRDGERPRYARDPQLRDDVEGHDVVVMIQRLEDIDPDYEGPAYWSTVFANLGEERTQELAEGYAEGDEDASPSDFVTELDGDEFVRLQPTDEFEPMQDMVRDTGWIQWNRPDLKEMNGARVENGLDVYVPDGSSRAEALPEGVSESDVDFTGPGLQSDEAEA